MKYDIIAIGNRAYQARISKGLKQEDLSAALDISQPTYSKFENGRYEPSLTKIFVLCDILDIKLSWLLGEIDDDLTAKEQLELEKYKKYIISSRH